MNNQDINKIKRDGIIKLITFSLLKRPNKYLK